MSHKPGEKLPRPIASSAWISPSGDFHYVPDCQHYSVARNVLLPDVPEAVYLLERRGWLHLSFGDVLPPMKPITNSQLDTLFDTLVAYREAAYSYAERLDKTIQWLMEKMDAEV